MKRKGLMVLVSLISLIIGVSICNAEYVGYYGTAQEGLGSGNYISTVESFSNIVSVSTDEENPTARANGDVQKIAQAASYGLKSTVMIDHLLFDIIFDGDVLISIRLRSDYVSRWNTYAGIIGSHINDIAMFYTLDEPYHNACFSAQEPISMPRMKLALALVNALVKNTFSGTKTAVVFAFATFNVNHECHYVPGRNDNFIVPNGYNFIGFDYYYSIAHCGDHDIEEFKAEYLDYLGFLLSKSQLSHKLIFVPGAMCWIPCPVSQTELIAIADFYYGVTKTYPFRTGILVPFLYPNLPPNFTGVIDLDSVDQKWQSIFLEILAK